jgi:hypothetical protein
MKPTSRLLLVGISLVLFFGSLTFAQKPVHVRTYTRKDGTVVQAHNRAAPGAANRSSTSSSRGQSSSATNTPIYTAPVYDPPTSRVRNVTIERDSHGRIKRSESAKRGFMILHPCPVTGRTSGPCPGYVIDHINPLACGGVDAPLNMQWQTTAAAKAKDKWERKGCR